MTNRYRRALPTVASYLDDRIVRWRTGTVEGQVLVLSVLLVMSSLVAGASLYDYALFPAATFIVPILLGTLALRFRPLLVLVIFTTIGVTASVTRHSLSAGMTIGRISTLVVMAVVLAIVLYDSSRRRSGLPGPLGEAMLVDLRDRLQAQGVVPALPPGWTSQSAMRSAGGINFAGDFLVADMSSDESWLEMILVDVCGKGVAAGTQSLHFAGALGGLIGALPPQGLFAAANDFLLRQEWNEGFATAVHVRIDLESGAYSIISAGHPPALHWVAAIQEWVVDGARGTALGIAPRPAFVEATGELAAGDALMFYTDGVVESRTQDFTEGIAWLRGVASAVVRRGFDHAARRILDEVSSREDDRAILILHRTGASNTRK